MQRVFESLRNMFRDSLQHNKFSEMPAASFRMMILKVSGVFATKLRDGSPRGDGRALQKGSQRERNRRSFFIDCPRVWRKPFAARQS